MFANCGYGLSAAAGRIRRRRTVWASFLLSYLTLPAGLTDGISCRADSRVKIKPLNIFVNYGTVPACSGCCCMC